MTIQTSIREIVAGRHLDEERAFDVATAIMAGQATPSQIAALLVGLRMKGETVDEIIEEMTRELKFEPPDQGS